MEWTRRQVVLALAMLEGGSKARWETYERLRACEWTEEPFLLSDVRGVLSEEEYQWLSETDFQVLEGQYHEKGIHFLMIEDEAYPERLRQIYLPPIALFYRGDLSLLKKRMLGIVGSRRHTDYSTQALELLIPSLVRERVVVVSGMAAGVDSIAHRTTLHHRGKTVAVVGTGLDVCYPRENESLYEKMAESGLVVSEYPMGSQPLKYHFPYRNRIIAGLSHAVCVTEAKMKSGSLITANVALSENRTVFALPGKITSPYSQGTNALIMAGATPVTEAEDILRELTYFP